MREQRAVLDTNVLLAALRSKRGASNRLLELFGKGKIKIHISVPLVLEYEAILRRQAKDLGLTYRDVSEFMDYICREGERQDIHFLWRPALKDPNDDMVLELAVAAEADIVTFNIRDFGGAERFGVRVWEPGVYLRKLEEKS
jgi:putative PIN family toxin of toxin-antitoxin system